MLPNECPVGCCEQPSIFWSGEDVEFSTQFPVRIWPLSVIRISQTQKLKNSTFADLMGFSRQSSCGFMRPSPCRYVEIPDQHDTWLRRRTAIWRETSVCPAYHRTHRAARFPPPFGRLAVRSRARGSGRFGWWRTINRHAIAGGGLPPAGVSGASPGRVACHPPSSQSTT